MSDNSIDYNLLTRALLRLERTMDLCDCVTRGEGGREGKEGKMKEGGREGGRGGGGEGREGGKEGGREGVISIPV